MTRQLRFYLFFIIVSLVLGLALFGCANHAPQTPAASIKQISTINDLLVYHRSLKHLSPQNLEREWQTLNARQGGSILALQKALVLGLTHDANDLARAQLQLSNVLAAPDSATLQPLAELLVSNYAEMRRLTSNVEKANQQAKDSQRRLDQLSEKLQALKNIERTLPNHPKNLSP